MSTTHKSDWKHDDQHFEAEWWGNCVNTYGEETKQLTYAHRMSIEILNTDGHWPVYDLGGKSVIDIGGGPTSILLKAVNVTNPTVVDPCPYPAWIATRYKVAGIKYLLKTGEDFQPRAKYDECWIYNVLQHVQDPELIINNAKKYAKTLRIFEWIDLPAHPGHPHELKAKYLDKWLGGKGQVEDMNENGCTGRAYYGVFEFTS